MCFQRNENDPVPGCRGGEDDRSRTDYCIDDSAPAPTPAPVSSGGNKPLRYSTSFPLGECEGMSNIFPGTVRLILSLRANFLSFA